MPHFDEAAERSIIVALCVTDQAAQVFRGLNDTDFYSQTYADQFKDLKKAYAEGTLHEAVSQLIDRGLPASDGVVPLFAAIKVVMNHSIRRGMDRAVSELTIMTGDYTFGVGSIQDRFKELAVNVMDSRVCKVPSFTREDVESYRAEIKNDTRAFITGFPEIDKKAPIQPGDFVVLAARPAVGKSALATSLLLTNFMGDERHHGILISIEMDRKQIYARLVSQMSNVPLSCFMNRTDYPPTDAQVFAAEDAEENIMREFPERWFQAGTATLAEIQQVVELEHPEFIMIDYVQIIKHVSKHGTVQKLDEISMFLRQLGLEYGVAVIVLAQLNRDANGLPPQISQIKGSGQFEQDATHIFLLDRPESERGVKQQGRSYHLNDRSPAPLVSDQAGVMTNMAALLVNKNRNGPVLYHLLSFNPKTTAFKSFES